MKSDLVWLLALVLVLGIIGCKKPASLVNHDRAEADPEVAVTDNAPPVEAPVAPPVEVAPAPEEVVQILPREKVAEPTTINSTALLESNTAEPEIPDPKVLDPRTQARVQALQSQIAKLSENLQNARNTVKEATAFHGELVAIYKADEKKAAELKAAQVFARMRASSCSS